MDIKSVEEPVVLSGVARLRYKLAAKYLGLSTRLLDRLCLKRTFTIQNEGSQRSRFLLVDELQFFLGIHPENSKGDAALNSDTRAAQTLAWRKKNGRVRRGSENN